ncbi:hypothetical protein RDWZM_004863 [Blomia tropicalis]|uniref:Uncharacterized protein n=1 Tax=Blomia tropicalis TaxID=40697 RepID=A0A9Q0RLT9_BLOTA|nr:hypothetical protein RDWZM_004863 [Blomia tropicalis]
MFSSIGFNFLIILIICLTKIVTSIQIDSKGLYGLILKKKALILGICPTQFNRTLTFVMYNTSSHYLHDQLYIYDSEQEMKPEMNLIHLDNMKSLKDKWPKLYAKMKNKLKSICFTPTAVVIRSPERVVVGCSNGFHHSDLFYFDINEPERVLFINASFSIGSAITTWIDKASMFYAIINVPSGGGYGSYQETRFAKLSIMIDHIDIVDSEIYVMLSNNVDKSLRRKRSDTEDDNEPGQYPYIPPDNDYIKNPKNLICGFIDSTKVRLIMYGENPPVITFDRKIFDSVRLRNGEIMLTKGKTKYKIAEKQYELKDLVYYGASQRSNGINGRSTTIIVTVISLIVILCICGIIVCFFIFNRTKPKPNEPKFDGNESKVNQSNVNVSTTSKKGSNVSTSKVKSTNRSRSHVPASVDKSSSKLGRSISKQRSGSLVAIKNSSTSPRKSFSTKLNSSTRLTKMSNKNQSSKSVLAKSKKISTTPKAIILARTPSKTSKNSKTKRNSHKQKPKKTN